MEASIEKAGNYINKYPHAHSTAIFVSRYLSEGPLEIALALDKADDSLLQIVREAYIPCKIIGDSSTGMKLPLLGGKKLVDGKSAVYICKNYSCQEPITDRSNLQDKLFVN